MKLESPETLRARGAQAWQGENPNNRRIVLLHTLPVVFLQLLLLAINLYLDNKLSSTSGLAGIDMRSKLKTIQTVLSLIVQVLLPFWQVGIIFAAMQIYRTGSAHTDTLWEGLRRWGAVLRLNLLRSFRYVVEILCGLFFGTLIFMSTPLSDGLLKTAGKLADDPAFQNATNEEMMDALMSSLGVWDILPYYLLCAIGVAVLFLPVFYRYRMSDYFLMDSDSSSAVKALRESTLAMQNNRWSLFLLDLRFWWYFLLLALGEAIVLLDLLLPVLNVQLPFSAQVSAFLFPAISSVFIACVYLLFRGRIETTYACVYQSLIQSEGGNEEIC